VNSEASRGGLLGTSSATPHDDGVNKLWTQLEADDGEEGEGQGKEAAGDEGEILQRTIVICEVR